MPFLLYKKMLSAHIKSRGDKQMKKTNGQNRQTHNPLYHEKQIQENLFQYEMGIELGADLEADKIKHRKIYEEKRRQIDHHKPNQ